MKTLKLNSNAFAGATQLSRAEMKNVMGGLLEEESGRCKMDVLCAFNGPNNEYLSGGCESVGARSQCRCVAYKNGEAFASVPHNGCLSQVSAE